MKKILLAAFGLLLFTSVMAQQQQRNKDNAMQGRRQIQNSKETNVAGQRIVTNLWGMEDGSGAFARIHGTNAVANSYSNKPKLNVQASSALVGSSKSPDNARRSDRTSIGETHVGASTKKKNINAARTRANTPVGKPQVHPPKYRSKEKGRSR